MTTSGDFLDARAFAEELRAALEDVNARLVAADHKPMAFTGASVKRSSEANLTLGEHIAARVARKFAELEERLAAAEQRRGLHYRGLWRGDAVYGRDDAATHSGSLWICQRQGTRAKPGDGDAWRLVSKRDIPA